MSRILVAVPHADELAFHCGGTIARLVGEGHDIYQVVVTTGAKSSFVRPRGEMEVIISEEARKSAEILGLKDIFLWNSGDNLNEHDTPIIQERLTALARYLNIDTIFGFDPSATRDAHPDQIIVGKASVWTAYFCAFPLHYPHQRDFGLEPCRITDQYQFAYHPEGDHLETLDISDTIEKKVEAVLAYESQMVWCADIEIDRMKRMGIPYDHIDRDNYSPAIADDVRREATERGASHGFAYAEIMRHISGGEVLT
jgi:LmbE family N-acetylglucosaminyl deacetylase